MIFNHLVLWIFVLCSFVGCATDVKINPRACKTKAEWLVLPEDQFKYQDMFVSYHPDEKIEDKHFVKIITLYAPFSFFTPQEFMLKDILDDVGLSCDQIRSVGLSFKEGFWDVLLNFIPPLSQITLVMEGELKGLENVDAPPEPAKSSTPDAMPDELDDEKDFDLE